MSGSKCARVNSVESDPGAEPDPQGIDRVRIAQDHDLIDTLVTELISVNGLAEPAELAIDDIGRDDAVAIRIAGLNHVPSQVQDYRADRDTRVPGRDQEWTAVSGAHVGRIDHDEASGATPLRYLAMQGAERCS